MLVVSQYVEPQYAIALLEHGSDGRGYLLKDRLHDRAQLVRAIEEVADDGSFVDPAVVRAPDGRPATARTVRWPACRPASA